MTMEWLVFALMTGAAVLAVLWPLARSRREAMPVERVLYEAQLAEIDREVERGLIAIPDAEGARAEAARAFLAVRPPLRGASQRRARIAAVVSLVLVPSVALSIYAKVGHPDIEDQPLAERLAAKPGQMDFAVVLSRIEAHLAAVPDDGRGFELIAPIYMRLGRVDDAVKAFGSALRILGPTPERFTDYAEALVTRADGRVTPDALAAFSSALSLDGRNAKARFYRGAAARQAGDDDTAKATWSELLDDAPPNAPYRAAVEKQLAALSSSARASAPQGPLADAIAAMPAADRMIAIRGMIEGLASRLAQDGSDTQGWLKLVRAYRVLQDDDKAKAALAQARLARASDPAAMAQLGALASELGLEGS